ncbi:ROK family transcriptional regulator [Alkalihalobacillus sp. APA_J-10(15)]|nr:ROK family transcriptional regulator [Halalkalibacter sp. APA_J-10(15)]
MFREFLLDPSKKNANKKALYELIHRKRLVSKGDLLDAFAVPQTTLTRMIHDLERKGWIQSGGIGPSKGGRPPVLYKANPLSGYIFGIEIARSVQVLLLNLEFAVIDKKVFLVTKKFTPDEMMSRIMNDMKQMMANHQLNDSDLVGIGVGAIGPVDREKGKMIHPESFRSFGWEEVSIVGKMEQQFHVPIILNNGANTAAIAEYKIQEYSNKNLLYCISGYGIRCGIIQAGSSLNSKQGDASSYGHMIVQPGGRMCTCGKKGCLNAYSSFGAMFDLVQQIDSSLVLTSPENLIDALQNGEPTVEAVTHEAAYYYGLAIANMVNVLHPDVVLLQGKLIEQNERYLNRVIAVAKEHIYASHLTDLHIGKGKLGREAVAIGAAVELFQGFFVEIG